MTPESMLRMPERILLPLPQRFNPASEYDLHGGWNFEIGGADQRTRNAAQSLSQLLVNPQSWAVEAYKIQQDYWNRKGHFSFEYVFYSSSRERPKFSTKKLNLNLKEIVKPDIIEQYYNGGATSLDGVTHKWIKLRSPFSVVVDPETPTLQYSVEGVVLRDFNLYLKYKPGKNGGGDFDKPVYDPRRFVAELSLEDPIIVFKSQILAGLRRSGDIDKFIEQYRGKIPPELMTKVETMLAAIRDQEKTIIADLSKETLVVDVRGSSSLRF